MNLIEKVDMYKKVLAVIRSCETYPQLIAAARYVNFFYRKHQVPEESRKAIRKIMDRQKLRVRLNGSKAKKAN